MADRNGLDYFVTLTGKVIRSTPKAVRFNVGGKWGWVPKQFIGEKDGSFTNGDELVFEVKAWKAREHGWA